MAAVCFPLSKLLFNFAKSLYKTCSVTTVHKNSASSHIHQSIQRIKSVFGVPVALVTRKGPMDAPEEIVHRIALATLALKDGNAAKSNRVLEKALALAEASHFPAGTVAVCDLLSSISIKSGDLNRAEDFLVRAVNTLVRSGAPEDDSLMVSLYLKLSRVYSQGGHTSLAEFGFRNCLRLQGRKVDESRSEEGFLLWMTILYWYGKFLAAESRFQEAKAWLTKCYLASEKAQGILPTQMMVVLYNLGEACQMLGDYDSALSYFKLGIAMDPEGRNPDLAYFYIKLCTIYMRKDLHKEAKYWCTLGKTLARKFTNAQVQNKKESNACLNKIDTFV